MTTLPPNQWRQWLDSGQRMLIQKLLDLFATEPRDALVIPQLGAHGVRHLNQYYRSRDAQVRISHQPFSIFRKTA